ncbi:hypothetical protein [Stutzerimonas stutzeri]|uniref:hypothetical protein n=1 Tax=Stutzerimonas stutzeri TaxID=316 RepID=UPI0002EEF6E0|nr:hypothetical protein [Stutzerimonas stutzeri]
MAQQQNTLQSMVAEMTEAAAVWRALPGQSAHLFIGTDAEGRVMWQIRGGFMGAQINPHSGRPMMMDRPGAQALIESAVLYVAAHPALIEKFERVTPITLRDYCEQQAAECERVAELIREQLGA